MPAMMEQNLPRRFRILFFSICIFIVTASLLLTPPIGAFRIPFFSHDDSEIIDLNTNAANTKFNHRKSSGRNPIANALESNVIGYLREVADEIDAEINATSPKAGGKPSSQNPVRQQSSIKRKALCTACKFLVHSVRVGHKIGFPKGILLDAVRDACVTFSGKTKRVCNGLITTFQDDIFSLLDKSHHSAREICSIFFSVCQLRTKDVGLSWSIILPAKRAGQAALTALGISEKVIAPLPERFVLIAAPAPKSSDVVKASVSKPLRMLHLADLHLDPYYKIGSLAICREPQCCRDDSDPDGRVGEGKVPRAGYWGFNGGFCDTPMQLLDAMLAHIAKYEHVDFIIWTGDAVPHDVWNQSRSYQLSVTATVNAAIKRHFPKMPVFPTLGNHESYPANSFPSPSVTGKNSIAWLYEPTATQWIGWGPDATQRGTILKGGYYSHRVRPGLKIISLNTNYCSKLNWWLMLSNDDPAGQMAWLVNELQDSEQKNEAVFIMSHISPSGDKCIKPWRDNYYRVVARFKDTIRGTFYGHSHYDEFGVTYDPANLAQPTTVAFLSPSATTYRHLNPAYRIFLVDLPNSGSNKPPYTLLDMDTYIANLTAANEKAASRPGGVGNAEQDLKWELEYSAIKEYSLPDMSSQSWSDLSKRMRNDPKIFKIYYDNYYKQQEFWTQKTCVGGCRETKLCNTQSNACTNGDGILLW